MTKISEAWKALGDDDKKKYDDAAAVAKAKFIEEYGEAALKRGPNKKIKQKGEGTDAMDLDANEDAKPAAEPRRPVKASDNQPQRTLELDFEVHATAVKKANGAMKCKAVGCPKNSQGASQGFCRAHHNRYQICMGLCESWDCVCGERCPDFQARCGVCHRWKGGKHPQTGQTFKYANDQDEDAPNVVSTDSDGVDGKPAAASESTAAVSNCEDQSLKTQGRGRPRKHPLPDNVSAVDASTTTAAGTVVV